MSEMSGSSPRERPSLAGQTRGEASLHEVERAASDLVASVNDLARVGEAYVEEQVKTRPYAVLGAAAGLGFVLGGGLASRATGVLFSLGARLFVARLFEDAAGRRDGAAPVESRGSGWKQEGS